MFFFFRKPVTEIISLVPPEFEYALSYTPIKEASKCLPGWWKNLTVNKFDWESLSLSRNAKTCPGINKTITKGAILPLWTDLAIRIRNGEYKYQFADKRSMLSHHSNEQAPGFYSDHFIFKIRSPWFIKTKVPLHYSFPFYHFVNDPGYSTPPGIVYSQGGICATSIFIMMKQYQDCNLMIDRNTPLLHILPITEKKVIYRVEICDERDHERAKVFLGSNETFVAARVKNERLVKNNES